MPDIMFGKEKLVKRQQHQWHACLWWKWVQKCDISCIHIGCHTGAHQRKYLDAPCNLLFISFPVFLFPGSFPIPSLFLPFPRCPCSFVPITYFYVPCSMFHVPISKFLTLTLTHGTLTLTHGSTDAWTQGHTDARTQGHKDTRTHKQRDIC